SLRCMRADGARTLRELSGRVTAPAAGDAAARRRDLRLRETGRRLRRRAGPSPRRAAAAARRLAAPAGARSGGTGTPRGLGGGRDLPGRRPLDSRLPTAAVALRGPAQRLPAGRRREPLRDLG